MKNRLNLFGLDAKQPLIDICVIMFSVSVILLFILGPIFLCLFFYDYSYPGKVAAYFIAIDYLYPLKLVINEIIVRLTKIVFNIYDVLMGIEHYDPNLGKPKNNYAMKNCKFEDTTAGLQREMLKPYTGSREEIEYTMKMDGKAGSIMGDILLYNFELYSEVPVHLSTTPDILTFKAIKYTLKHNGVVVRIFIELRNSEKVFGRRLGIDESILT